MTVTPQRPLQNRVTPFSAIERNPARGLFMGNRGILHGAERTLNTEKWRHKAWVICTLTHTDKKGRTWHRSVMKPNHYTELFFLDEVTALAAGHRPCALCQHARFKAFMSKTDHTRAPGIDFALHQERTATHFGNTRYKIATLCALPATCLVLPPNEKNHPYLWNGRTLQRWHHHGYGPPIESDLEAEVRILTPSLTLNAIRRGYVPIPHPSAAL